MNGIDRRLFTLAVALGLAMTVSACKREAGETETDVKEAPPAETVADEVRVANVELGRSIGADKKINDNQATDEFKRTDTIYASVDTDGNGSGSSLTAHWTFEDGQVVDETTQTLAVSGPAVTEFHISKPDGFPVGKYKVEIRLNGKAVETKDFEVK